MLSTCNRRRHVGLVFHSDVQPHAHIPQLYGAGCSLIASNVYYLTPPYQPLNCYVSAAAADQGTVSGGCVKEYIENK